MGPQEPHGGGRCALFSDGASLEYCSLASLAEQIGIKTVAIPLTEDLQLDMDAYARLLITHSPKLVAVTHVSNSLGTLNDIATITTLAHDAGAVVMVDGAQSVPHLSVDVQALN